MPRALRLINLYNYFTIKQDEFKGGKEKKRVQVVPRKRQVVQKGVTSSPFIIHLMPKVFNFYPADANII